MFSMLLFFVYQLSSPAGGMFLTIVDFVVVVVVVVVFPSGVS